MATINSLTDGVTAVGSDEFVINRAGTDYKLNHTAVVAGVTALVTAEEAARIAADLTLTNTKLDIAGGSMTGSLSLNAAPTASLHAATKLYVDTADALKLDLAGGTMTGYLNLVGAPTANLHAAPKQYVDSVASGRWGVATGIYCNTNPNYPASKPGDTYVVASAGRIGGPSGLVVQQNDLIYCAFTSVGGTQAAVGSQFIILQTNLVQASDTEQGYVRIATTAERTAGTDNTVAMTALGVREVVKDLVPNYDKTVTASTGINVNATLLSHVYLCTGTGSGAVNVQLPQISSYSNPNITLVIKDAGINGATNNITINRSSSDTIDGTTSTVISTNGGVVTLINDGGTAWYTI